MARFKLIIEMSTSDFNPPRWPRSLCRVLLGVHDRIETDGVLFNRTPIKDDCGNVIGECSLIGNPGTDTIKF